MITKFRIAPNPFQAARIIAECNKLGKVDTSFSIYKELLRSQHKPDVFVYCALINVCRNSKQYSRAAAVYDDMCNANVPLDEKCFKLISVIAAEANDSVLATRILKSLHLEALPFPLDNVSCARLIQALSPAMDDVLQVLSLMDKHGVIPDLITYGAILKACISSNESSVGKRIHNHIKNNYLDIPTRLQNNLLHMYSKCGDLKAALVLFREMVKNKKADLYSWNIVLASCTNNGEPEQTFILFEEMQQNNVRLGIAQGNSN